MLRELHPDETYEEWLGKAKAYAIATYEVRKILQQRDIDFIGYITKIVIKIIKDIELATITRVLEVGDHNILPNYDLQTLLECTNQVNDLVINCGENE